MKKLTLLFTFLIIILSVSIAFGQNALPAKNNKSNFRNDGKRLLRELNLSQEQMQKIREINQANRPKARELNQRLRQARRELNEAIYTDNFDEVVLESRLRSVVEAQAELTKLRTNTELSVRKVLTPEQLKRFRELRKQFAERRKKRMMRQKRNRDGTPRRNRRNGEGTRTPRSQ